jgi:hypothetical protein
MKCASNILYSVNSVSSLTLEQERFQDREVAIKSFSNSSMAVIKWMIS